MIQTEVTPYDTDFSMSVSLPSDYIGKKVHVLFYVDEEVKKTPALINSKKKPSDFFGILTKQEGDKLDKHIKKIRNEWSRDI
jgi:hypothetical protein